MKAIKMRIQKSSRPLVILLATVVAIITSIVVANATQTFATPNAASISYSLAAGTSSAAITPALNRAVLVMGCCTTLGFQGVGQVSLVRISNNNVLEWVGSAITQGTGGSAVAHIVYINFQHEVDIQVASVDTIRIHNGSVGTRAGNVTLIW
jgi:hypothetical protein